MTNFGLIGAAGYIAPRHLKAIKETGNNLLAALDPFDSVGIIDSYFPDAAFFTEPERFDRHMDKLRRSGNGHIEYVSICSPNYLHDAHIRMALRNGANAICEKPIVLNPWNIDALCELERETGRKIYTILQLRHHAAIISLKERVEKELALNPGKQYKVNLNYITSRGAWYYRSWKGDVHKSGGVATNIGVHFFDMLTWIFGPCHSNEVHEMEADHGKGTLGLTHATVDWSLSINRAHLPQQAVDAGKTTFRSITVDGAEVEFSDGFTDLHTVSYRNILEGKGFGIEEARASIEIVREIRDAKP
ncbi:MAG: oxidoreductase [Bacteroidetes bacterium GWE2_42_24]|nr:MAG: oxidoreductase [Bacteroidetes bacterium GWE2_42_24]OFY31182.1 MAG: oxidoreductase [Bacteroidetes bacterium GWF2_43_11]HCT86508.1 oxidoreductase [Candidatus Margulisiibacteriota bacterium]